MARVLMIGYTTYICDGRVKRHAEALVERGDTVDLICLAAEQSSELKGVNMIGLPIPRYRGPSRIAYLGSYARFFAIVSWIAARRSVRHPYDLVVVCTPPDAAVLCALIPRLFGSKILLDIHDTMPELYEDKFTGTRAAVGAKLLMLEERASAWFAHRVLAVHGLHAERLRRSGIPPEKISVVLNSPDPRLFQPFHQEEVNGRQDSFTLICHGTISRRLGVDIAIQAMHLLRDRRPAVRLRLVGIGDYKEPARALVERLGLQTRVSFEHRVPIEQLGAVLKQASAGLVPNQASSATHLMLPAKLFEYAVVGIPVIAARLRTIEHYFPSDCVRYFEPGNPESLADAIDDLYLHPQYRRALIRRASEVSASLSWVNQRRQLFATIDSLLNQREA